MVKYKEVFKQMCDAHQAKIEAFQRLSERYAKDKAAFKEQFDREGKEILMIISQYEQRLCGHMERGNKAVFSSNLSDKFWGEIRKVFPLIDEVGVKKSFVKV